MKAYDFRKAIITLLLAVPFAWSQERTAPVGYTEWKVYHGSPESIHYSNLNQINRDNVHKLAVAWTFDTGDAFKGSELQCNPVIAHGVLYATSPKARLFALDAATGKVRWIFDPYHGEKNSGLYRIRGITYWEWGKDRRIFYAVRQYLYAINATTGKPVKSFGKDGRIDLREGLGRNPETVTVSINTPGIIYKDLLIMGSLVSEDLPAAPGDIRAIDVRTGKLRWIFHTIPHPGELGYETWPKDAWTYIGGANNWAGMSLDEKRGLVFVPTGSAAFDFYGGNRIGDNLFANTLLALKAETGERVWHFQGVRHDTWDRDFPAPPTLVTVRRDGRLIDAVAQPTKSGHLYVFERETGKPLFPIEYRKVPPSQVEGEVLAETQPLPLKPAPFARQEFTRDMIMRRTPETYGALLDWFDKVQNGGQFNPLSYRGSFIFPGCDGGAEWGGAAFDPETGVIYVNSNEMVFVMKIAERPVIGQRSTGRRAYASQCASCHREDMKGTPPEFPSLVKIGEKLSQAEIARIIREGRGRMPNFSHLGTDGIAAVTQFLSTGEDKEYTAPAGPLPAYWTKYTFGGYNKFLDKDGYPGFVPPWGTLNAINLDTGEYVWKIPFGEFPELAAKGLTNTGSENYGGAIVTAGGLLFIGATDHDRKFHAFDKLTGKLLWEATLPAAGNATPAMYEIKGRQYIVIAAGGGKWGEPSGGSYVAFALPK
ncbi:MAG: PQQ-binding-like beta-propeller repeat protein [Acidobacteria bacterium]|nr:PQQ-binding-like beta-propeller repeat protein [Acidobacteriota bacterium]